MTARDVYEFRPRRDWCHTPVRGRGHQFRVNRVAPRTGVGLVGEELILPRSVLVPKELVLGRVVLGGEELVLFPCQLLSLWQRHESLSVLKKVQKLKKWRTNDEEFHFWP